jgi:transposase
MGRKRHTPEEIVARLRPLDVLVAQGQTIDAAARSIGVTQTTSHRWREPSSAASSSTKSSA